MLVSVILSLSVIVLGSGKRRKGSMAKGSRRSRGRASRQRRPPQRPPVSPRTRRLTRQALYAVSVPADLPPISRRELVGRGRARATRLVRRNWWLRQLPFGSLGLAIYGSRRDQSTRDSGRSLKTDRVDVVRRCKDKPSSRRAGKSGPNPSRKRFIPWCH